MARPTIVDGGTGATDAGGAWTYTCQAAAAAGRVFIVQILQDGSTNGAITSVVGTNIEDLAGTDDAWTQIPGANADGSFPVGASGEARQFLYIGRALSTSAPTISGGNSTSEDLYIRSYQFTTVSTGTTLATVIENGTAGSTANSTGTDATATDAGVTTLGPDRLALQFVSVNDDNAISAFSGETNGNWAYQAGITAYAESSGTDGAIAMQWSAAASATTIDGGSGSIVDSDAWGCIGLALIGTTVEGPVTYVPRHPAHDFGSVTNF